MSSSSKLHPLLESGHLGVLVPMPTLPVPGGNPEDEEPEPEQLEQPLPPSIPSLTPVAFKHSQGGNVTYGNWQPFPQTTIRDLCKAHKDYSRESPCFRGLLKADLTGVAFVPADMKQLFSCLMYSIEYKLWDTAWRKLLRDALPNLLANPETAIDEQGNPLTTDHQCGERQWACPADQVANIPIPALQIIADSAAKAFFSMQPHGPLPPCSKMRQGPMEPFVDYVERLTRAIELQVK
ncbi:hypothetical protein DUI87_05105 [Hirundo rustica rustica]|uniref:Uncharacterized protein n=1 Tax=Hirundo rustica rustica TaxID=333673 RepID=A0A3M0L339_HIRRU|nr:hypothetical protein DUI87_05105 [Hirundo rustica rustica]